MFTHTRFATAPNPYANFGSSGADFDAPVAARTSILAITALVLGILCFIPGLGILALLLGGAAIILISRSQGRLTGLGLAVAGCVLGLVSTVVTLFLVVGAMGAMKTVNAAMLQMLVPTQRALVAMENKDYKAARAEFSPTLAGLVTDEQMATFADEYQAKLGKFKASPQTFMDYMRGWMALGQQMGANNPNMQQQNGQNGMPIPAEFDKGWALILVEFPPGFRPNPQAAGSGTAPFTIENLAIMQVDGKMSWLVDPAKTGWNAQGGTGADPSTGGPDGQYPSAPDGSGDTKPGAGSDAPGASGGSGAAGG